MRNPVNKDSNRRECSTVIYLYLLLSCNMGLHKVIIPFYSTGSGYKKDFREAAAVAVAATAKMPNFIKQPQPAPY